VGWSLLYRAQGAPDDVASDSPDFPRAADSRKQLAAPSEAKPPTSTIKAMNGDGFSDHSDRNSRDGKAKAKKASTDKPHRSKHKTKTSSSSSRHHHHHRDPTGGSAKLKINERPPDSS
jgi:hypothetical protein